VIIPGESNDRTLAEASPKGNRLVEQAPPFDPHQAGFSLAKGMKLMSWSYRTDQGLRALWYFVSHTRKIKRSPTSVSTSVHSLPLKVFQRASTIRCWGLPGRRLAFR
jgi:hypothetical protein